MTAALDPYRVLDLTDERGWFAGKLLADLGAEVVKVEPPGGDPGRAVGPFAGDEPGPDTGLAWLAHNRGKRSLEIDLTDGLGREELLRQAAQADILIESFDAGGLAARGLGVDALLAANPALVVVSISAFGCSGPAAGWAGSDLVAFAMCGLAYLTGDPDRAPLRISTPQMFRHACAEAAAHAVIALYHARRTGHGQHVDVSAQLAGIRTLMNAQAFPYLHGYEQERNGPYVALGEGRRRLIYECADGHVTMLPAAGQIGGPMMNFLMAWADREGLMDELLCGVDFASVSTMGGEAVAVLDAANETLERLFRRYTKAELYAEALAHGLLIAPVNTIADLLADEQLSARQYFVDVDGATYPGAWCRLSGTPLQNGGRAPRLGEAPATRATRPPRSPATPVASHEQGVFQGLKVWDMSWVGVGPMAAGYLSAQGATVVKLDHSSRPDVLRLSPPFKDQQVGLNTSHFCADMNANKLGLGLDLRHAKAREIALRMAGWADVVLESFTAGTLTDLGLDYPALRAINPSLVMLSTCMQGQTGPRRAYRGFGNLMAAMCGFYEITGWPDRGPTFVYGAYTDFINQRLACAALVSALDHRDRTGEGQHLDLSQFEGALQFIAPEILDWTVNGRVLSRRGNRDPHRCPHGVFACRPVGGRSQGWVAIGCEDDRQWAALVDVLGRPQWATEDGLATCAGRQRVEDHLEAELAAWCAVRTVDEVVRALQPRVAAGPVHDQSGLHEDEQVLHYGYFVPLEHSVMGMVPYQGSAARLSRTPARFLSAGPCVGEHSWQVLTEILGMEEDEVADLLAEETVEITG